MGLFFFFLLLLLPARPPAPSVLMSDIMYGSACLGWLDARGPLQNPVTRQQCMSASAAEDSRAPRWAEPREKSHSSDLRGDECQVRRRAPLPPPPPSPSSPSHLSEPHRSLLAPVEAGKGSLLSFVSSFVFSFLIWEILVERDTLWIALGERLPRNTIF